QLHKYLFDTGFKFVKTIKVSPKISNIKIQSADKNLMPISVYCDDIILPTVTKNDVAKIGENSQITQQVFLPKFYYSPIKNGDNIGEIRYYYNSREIGLANLKAKISD
ncbi:MAG: hypothetical protein RSA79_06560, partial [Oscillospiraceae bacterium]